MNPVQAENALPGTRNWLLTLPATAREVEGYASATSVQSGEAINLYIHTTAAQVIVDVFRVGWYQGLGARQVFGPLSVPGIQQVMPVIDSDTGLVDCAWRDPLPLTTHGWTSGVYLARLTADDGMAHVSQGVQSYISFVVRDDTRVADLQVQLPFTTYQAYNAWGGKSLYHWGSSQHKRATKVSFNRPYAANAQNPAAAFGMGAGEFLTNLQPHGSHYPVSNAGWDVNMLRWLEREGFDVAYTTNLDTHVRAPSLHQCKAWLSIGHDEYWSHEMRNHVQAARDNGVHLAFFGANSAYWQIRLEPSAASGTDNRVMVCHKKAKADPCFAHNRSRATDKWRSEAVNQPEAALIGVMYAGDPVDAGIVVAAPDHWAFAATGLRAADTLAGLLGYEVDSLHTTSPSNITTLAASPWTALNDPGKQGTSHMTIYTAPSGAMVFATGSIQWAWGLDDFNAPGLRTSRLNVAAQRVTANVLQRFLNKPYITNPSTR